MMSSQPKKQPKSKKPSSPRGRPPKDLSDVSGSIPMDPEKFAKILLNTPPRTIKNR